MRDSTTGGTIESPGSLRLGNETPIKRAAARKKSTARKKRTRNEPSPKSTVTQRTRPPKDSRGGRPRIEIDTTKLRRMLERGNSIEGCADILGVARQTLHRRISEDQELAEFVARARATRNDKLHAAMMKSALGGNATMQIWLSKQWLGMRDVRAVELTGSGGGPLEVDSGLRPILEEKLREFLRSRGRE